MRGVPAGLEKPRGCLGECGLAVTPPTAQHRTSQKVTKNLEMLGAAFTL